ncbi:MAG: hypothetical protein AAB536_00290 [Patescibacteria group bacterium]
MPFDFIRRKAKTVFSLRGLLIKSCIFGLCWFFLPFWIFLLVGVYFYFTPFFQSFNLFIPFLMTLAAAAYVPYGFWPAVFLGILFFLILGIKNLIFVNRFENHQIMVFLLLFLIFFGFFSHFENWEKWIISTISLGIGLSFFLLFKELADYTRGNIGSKKNLAACLGSFLLWQASSVIIFLPINYFYQTALLFLLSVITTDVLLEYLNKNLDRKKILVDFSIFFAVTAAILASANWGL